MAKARDVRAGGAYVELNVRDNVAKALTAIQNRLKKVAEQSTAWGKSMLAASAAVSAPLALVTKHFISSGDALAKASARTGIAVEALSELRYAAEQSGTSMEGLEQGVRLMQRMLAEAKGGATEATVTLAALGLSVEELENLSPDQQLARFADALAAISDPGERAALAMRAFGKSGTALLPLLNGGAAGIDELREAAKRLGVTMSTEDAKAAESFGDRLDDIRKIMGGVAQKVGASLVPVLTDFVHQLIEGGERLTHWLDNNRQLVREWAQMAIKGAAVTAVLGGALLAFGQLASASAAVVGGIKGIAAAMVFLYAHPAFAAISLMAAAVVGLGVAIKAIGPQVDQFSLLMSDVLDKGDQMRQQDLRRLHRLRQLSEETELSNEQQAEAAKIIHDLNARYDDLGIRLDDTTGKIEGMADAQKRLNDAMKQATAAELRAAIAEAEANLKNLPKAFAEEKQGFLGSLGINARRIGGEIALTTDEKAELDRRLATEEARLQSLQARLAAMQAGDDAAIVPAGGQSEQSRQAGPGLGGLKSREDAIAEHQRLEQTAQQKAQSQLEKQIETAIAARKQLDQVERDARRRSQSDLENEIEDTRELYELRRHLLKAIIAGEKAKGAKADREVIADAERQLDTLGHKLVRRVNELKTAAAAAMTQAIDQSLEDFFSPIEELRVNTEDVLADIQQRIESRGTFNAAAIRSLESAPVYDRIAKASEKTARNTDRLVADGLGLV